ncbi:hypothetical protein [Paenibacillus donghaensis]|uniref:Uncharacterized protein n=1 Tax=Paenibacillus donghaensis TaxID=414771 RepID=A0A2Z2KH81_9BACL|nr:hypothetical protein [Paenibacillus donghaensis]ASA22530.1 hypothetical protein B9T62_18130 [Paenibacillus donghaensis]
MIEISQVPVIMGPPGRNYLYIEDRAGVLFQDMFYRLSNAVVAPTAQSGRGVTSGSRLSLLGQAASMGSPIKVIWTAEGRI